MRSGWLGFNFSLQIRVQNWQFVGLSNQHGISLNVVQPMCNLKESLLAGMQMDPTRD
jgi:hypothetical protein